jgi:hypothetical protein
MVLHYGLLIEVEGTSYQFDKHWAYGFDPFQCPPWTLSSVFNATHGNAGGLFPHPPPASSLKTSVSCDYGYLIG